MAVKKSLDEQVAEAVELLPPVGEAIEFNEFKAKLYAVNPDGGKDAFTFMLKNGMVKSKVKRQPDKSMKTTLERPA